MKRVIYLLVVCAVILFSSCDNKEKEIKNFVYNLPTIVKSGNKENIKNIYPDFQDGDSIVMPQLDENTIDISPAKEENVYLVTLGNGVDLTVMCYDDGKINIKKSHGLFAYEPNRLEWSKSVGQYKPDLDDVTNAARMRDNRFLEEIKQQIVDQVRLGLKAQCINSGFRESDFSVGFSVKVTNDNDFDIPGDMYEVKATLMGFDTERLVDVVAQRKTLTGKDIPAGGSVTYSLGRTDAEYGSWRAGGVTVTDVPVSVLMKLYTPHGNEFDAYVKAHGVIAPSQAGESLNLSLTGIMGGCGTELTFNATSGTLKYNPHGKSLNGNLEQRSASLVSYDPVSGALVIQIKNGDTTTGNLDGTLKDGTYNGRFKNVNGKSSSFSLK